MDLFELLDIVQIKDYIGQFNNNEFEEENGEYWCTSLFNPNERTPSFSINPDNNVFYDFSSGKGGNVIDFITQYEKCSVGQAVKKLEKFAGVDTDVTQMGTAVLDSTRIARKYKNKEKTKKGAEYKVLDDSYMERFEVNNEKYSVWLNEGISEESLKKYEVKYDAFSNRLVFPVRSLDGKIINVCGRTLNPNYKEAKIKKYCYYFPLGRLDTLYGFYENKEEILKKKEIILFEGSKSVMIADSWGIRNTAAILTSHLNPYQFEILVKLGIRVVFALDADINIKEDKNIQRLLPYVQVEYIKDTYKLLNGKDAPVDRGKEVFDRLYLERRRL